MLEGTTQNLLLDFEAPPGPNDFNFPPDLKGPETGRKINHRKKQQQEEELVSPAENRTSEGVIILHGDACLHLQPHQNPGGLTHFGLRTRSARERSHQTFQTLNTTVPPV